ncbi:MAG: flagellar hook-length control protein FliK [Methylobacterium sp.]
MMAIFTAPPPPIAPAGPAGGAGEEGEAGIVTTDLAASGAGDLAATSPARGAKPATPGFEAALTEIASDGPGLDAAKVELMQPSEASATAGGTTALTAPAEAKAATAPQQTAPASAPVPLGAVPMTIGLRALGSSNRFEIRLDPKELGRIDVSIDIDKDTGTVGARLVVDRPETLALLQRDASSLQQALAQTGLDASAGISLSLRSGGEDQRHDTNADAEAQGRRGRLSDSDGSEAGTDHSPVDLVPLRALRGLGRVDIRI